MINQFDPKNRDFLCKIQGNILKGHGREHTANMFITSKPNKVEMTKRWLNELVDDTTGIIKSGYMQLKAIENWKNLGKDSGIFACIHISYDGYKYLFGEKIATEKFKSTSFKLGMKNSSPEIPSPDISNTLGDPPLTQWEAGFQNEIHFLLILADIKEETVIERANLIKSDIREFADVITIEYGNAIKNEDNAGIEHFGYVDGVSQPLFFEEEMNDFLKKNHVSEIEKLQYNPSANKSLVLVDDPFVNVKDAFGSFFVFRKLEQNVREFKEEEEKLGDELGLIGEDKERVGAMIVGRFEDGTPIELSGEAGMIDGFNNNNFNFDFNNGTKCPFHAHIRKTNPRNDLGEKAKDHVMARRGIPYGKRTDDPFDGKIATKPTRGVGLLFMSYQASIENQFEFIQKSWANNEDFINRNQIDKNGLDLIIGQGDSKALGAYALKWGKPATKQLGFDQFVTMKGGEYFFAPSIPFLKTIK